MRIDVRDERVSLRAFLIDSAYFLVKDELEAALGAAAALGARGEWYSGDHVAGRHAVLPKAPARAELFALPKVRAWTGEAMALDEAAGSDGATRAMPTAKRANPAAAKKKKAAPAKKPAAKKSAAKKPTAKKKNR